jgi:hypothetical protein
VLAELAEPPPPQCVCRRSRAASSDAPTDPHDSPGAILNLWHQHLDGSPPVPNTAWMSSQLAMLAGITFTLGAIVADASKAGTPVVRAEVLHEGLVINPHQHQPQFFVPKSVRRRVAAIRSPDRVRGF